ncbi:MAG: hypothetical protein ACYTG6_07615 [Planctomycetota bacterium]|jgi:hypothetical protein
MRALHLVLVAACVLFFRGAGEGALAAPDAPSPEASQVVVRRVQSLDAAILAAFGDRDGAAEQMGALVIDVTPYTRQQTDAIGEALRALDGHPDIPRPWRIAALGRPFLDRLWSPGELALQLPAVLSEDTDARDTIGALRKTLKSLDVRGGTVIYLADWRFEDEHDLEPFIRDLAAKRLAFGVVGSEAAFGRGWNDGVLDLRDQLRDGRLVLQDPAKQERYDETIGRRPFGPFDRNAPWHGGETAWPHLPYRWSGDYWETTFAPSALGFGGIDPGSLASPADLEDLLERLGREPGTFASTSGRKTALPSAYGPYGLMRAAAESGGRYVLWSWNPEHRASLEYDYARCNLFGPDLRSRSEIREHVRRSTLARALLEAWHAVGSKFNALAEHTAPLDRRGTRPQSIDLLERPAATLHTMWMDRNMHKEFLRKAKHWRDAAASGVERLTQALERADELRDGADRRYEADALLFRHILQVLHFELSEAVAAAETVPEDAWKNEDAYPGIRQEPWVVPGDDPEAIRTTDARVFDAGLGARLVEARREHLRRFRGTPFGVQVAANSVATWVLTKGAKIEPSTVPLQPTGRTPGESDGTPPPPSPRPPGGGSSGGGPSTGRR